MKNLTSWAKGLFAAIVAAASNAVVMAIADPKKFNPSLAGWHDLGTLVVVSSVVGAAMYLKQSPVPAPAVAIVPANPPKT